MGGGVLSHRLVCATVGAGSLDKTEIRKLCEKVKYYPSSSSEQNGILHSAVSNFDRSVKSNEIRKTASGPCG